MGAPAQARAVVGPAVTARMGATPPHPAARQQQQQQWRRALQQQQQHRRSLAAAAVAPPPTRGIRLQCHASYVGAAGLMGGGGTVDVETARKMLDGAATVLDIRSVREYDDGHITKPPRRCSNVPFGCGSEASFVADVRAIFPNPATQLLLMCADGGQASARAAQLLAEAGYRDAAVVEGGWAGYSSVWGPSGKRRPPSGRWVSTGKEALKSGLNIPGVAESYDEGGNLKSARWAQGGGIFYEGAPPAQQQQPQQQQAWGQSGQAPPPPPQQQGGQW